jgi:L-lactate dehydrogenase complex protein LldE
MRVGLFVTCLVDLMRPSIGFAAIKLLESGGAEVYVPPTQTCCGQPGYNSGDRAGATALASKLVSEFEACDYLVAPSGSCSGMIRTHYADLFRDDPAMLRRAAALGAKTRELTDFLVNVLKLQAVPGKFSGKVTYHDCCAGLREMNVKQPRVLLQKMPGVRLARDGRLRNAVVSAARSRSSSVTSRRMANKCQHIADTGADAVVLGDLGCVLNIEGRMRRRGDTRTRVLYIAEMGGRASIHDARRNERLRCTSHRCISRSARRSLDDAQLQQNLQKFRGKFVTKRREAMTELDDFEGTRDAAQAIRQRALADLDTWLEMFEVNATARGATVLWAETPADVNRHVLEIAKRHDVAKIIKSKSMVSEESELDRAIEAAGLKVVETDLGEYILQINDYEPPSHIIGPALHQSKEEVADLFAKAHGTRADGNHRPVLRGQQVLRTHYLTATWASRGTVAETAPWSSTNEGNATLTTTLPKVWRSRVSRRSCPRSRTSLRCCAAAAFRDRPSISNYVDV